MVEGNDDIQVEYTIYGKTMSKNDCRGIIWIETLFNSVQIWKK